MKMYQKSDLQRQLRKLTNLRGRYKKTIKKKHTLRDACGAGGKKIKICSILIREIREATAAMKKQQDIIKMEHLKNK